MIKVNLLTQSISPTGGTTITSMGSGNVEEEGGSEVSPEVRNQAISKVLMILMPIIGMYFYAEFYNIPQLRQKASQLAVQVNELEAYNQKNEALTAEIAKINEDQTNIRNRIKTIQDISRRRFDEIKFVENLQQMIVDRVYLMTMIYRDGKVSITGYGETVKDVIDFQDQLQKSALLRDVVLVQQNDETLNEQTVKRFDMTFRLEENL